jgi:predicted PurR-regulated permease PerM
MPRPIGSTIDMLLNVGADTLIGALILAVLIAVLTAGFYLWLRRGKSDVTTILVALILVANLACLVTGAGFIQSRSRSQLVGLLPNGRAVHAPRRLVRPATNRHASPKPIVYRDNTPGPPESSSQSD